MEQGEKYLLLKDLCGRLPYHLIVNWNSSEGVFKDIESNEDSNLEVWLIHEVRLGTIKPYLRPLSNMTEDEKDELYDWGWEVNGNEIYSGGSTDVNNVYQTYQKGLRDVQWLIDWLNAHHFDYRGLIEKGLALEAPEGMYKTE